MSRFQKLRQNGSQASIVRRQRGTVDSDSETYSETMLGTETYGVGGSVSAGSDSFTWSQTASDNLILSPRFLPTTPRRPEPRSGDIIEPGRVSPRFLPTTPPVLRGHAPKRRVFGNPEKMTVRFI
jgi:hypothetical protein